LQNPPALQHTNVNRDRDMQFSSSKQSDIEKVSIITHKKPRLRTLLWGKLCNFIHYNVQYVTFIVGDVLHTEIATWDTRSWQILHNIVLLEHKKKKKKTPTSILMRTPVPEPPTLRPLQNIVHTGSAKRPPAFKSLQAFLLDFSHSKAIRRRPVDISRTRDCVGIANSSNKRGALLESSCTQKVTLPFL
jgi:hypothetical protein